MAQQQSTAKVPKRKLRAIRARRRRQARERSRDIRDRYRQRDIPTHSIGTRTIENPYDGTPEIAFVNLREDPLGRMFARHQVDTAQYQAGRCYQDIWDSAQIGSVGAIDISKPFVDGGQMPELLTDGQKRAAHRLRVVEHALLIRVGCDGISITRVVLAERKSVEQGARMHGARSEREIHSWCWLFRRALDVVAMRLGYANSTYRDHMRAHQQQEPIADPADDPDYHADARDLGDSLLRHAVPVV